MKTLPLPTPDNPAVVMTCDCRGCLALVKRAPRICVPSRTPEEPLHWPIKIMTTLHYCEDHKHTFQPSMYWTDRIKCQAEERARRLRPDDFRLDFERAYCEMMLVTTPEYREFMRRLGVNCVPF